jgi:hypothetical protein
MHCFCFKENYRSAKLGVGVSFGVKGPKKDIGSEFDLLPPRHLKYIGFESPYRVLLLKSGSRSRFQLGTGRE